MDLKPLVNAINVDALTQQFMLHYQPIVSLLQKKTIAFECLLRWQHPTFGMISPDQFIPLCETQNKIQLIGNWVIEQSCQQFSQWKKQHSALMEDMYITVNVSTHQLTSGLLPHLKKTLEHYGMLPRQFTIEITETAAIGDIALAVDVIQSLRNFGCDVLLDDFATVHASFSWLKILPVSGFKISYFFTQHLLENKTDQAIIESLLSLGKKLSLKIVIEGVETLSQLQWLQTRHTEYIQGDYFHHALESDRVIEFLQQPLVF